MLRIRANSNEVKPDHWSRQLDKSVQDYKTYVTVTRKLRLDLSYLLVLNEE